MELKDYLNYNFHYIPTKFTEECLVATDGLGYCYSKAFNYHRKTFHNNEVMYLTGGTLYVEQYGKKYTLKAGQGILMSLTDEHRYYTDKQDVAQVLWFHVRGTMITPLINRLFENQCLPDVYKRQALAG